MKKFLILAPFASIILGSCTTLSMKTATTKEVQVSVTSDLEIAQRKIRYKYVFDNSDNYRLSVAKENAISEALKINGDADILVSPQYEVSILGSQTEIIVSGFPAKYKNLRSISTDGSILRSTKDNLSEDKTVNIPTSIQKTTSDTKEKKETKKDSKKETSEPEVSIEEMYNLGKSYLNANNNKQAEKHLKQAAEKGHIEAQYELGCYYLANSGGNAEKWLKKAAENGYKDAQYELGCLYFGEGYTDKAKKWLQKAADQGHKEAKELLKNL